MNIEDVRNYALSLPAVTEDQAYGPDWVLFRIEEKIFLHLRLDASRPTCALKLNPDEAQMLREHHEAIQPADRRYHLNKTHWSDLVIDDLDKDLIISLINKSYYLVISKLPVKIRQKYIK